MWRENVAQALGGISPFDPLITRLNKVQVEVLLHWRMPRNPEEQKDDAFKDQARMVELADEAMFGKPEKSEGERLAEDHSGFDYLLTDDEQM